MPTSVHVVSYLSVVLLITCAAIVLHTSSLDETVWIKLEPEYDPKTVLVYVHEARGLLSPSLKYDIDTKGFVGNPGRTTPRWSRVVAYTPTPPPYFVTGSSYGPNPTWEEWGTLPDAVSELTLEVKDSNLNCCGSGTNGCCPENCCMMYLSPPIDYIGQVVVPVTFSGWVQLRTPFNGPEPAANLTLGAVRVTTRRTIHRPSLKMHGYCEQVRIGGPVAQPVLAWSNAPFAFSATWIALHSQSPSRVVQVFGAINAMAHAYAGVSSFLYHASLTSIAQRIDMGSVYSLILVPATFSLWVTIWGRRFAMAFAVTTLCMSVFPTLFNTAIDDTMGRSSTAVPATAVVLVAFELALVASKRAWAQLPPRPVVIAVVCIITAAVFRRLDYEEWACMPNSIWQWHAAWDVLAAVSLAANHALLVAMEGVPLPFTAPASPSSVPKKLTLKTRNRVVL